jgi:hypothetical protein
MLTVQVGLVPEQSPLQPPNVLPESGVAVKVTLVPPAEAVAQMEPQLIPDGLLVTVPDPDLVTLSM